MSASSRVSKINLYDDQTLSQKSVIRASGSQLVLPTNSVVGGIKLTDHSTSIKSLNAVVQEMTGKLIPTSEKSYGRNGIPKKR